MKAHVKAKDRLETDDGAGKILSFLSGFENSLIAVQQSEGAT
jgi:hypothetical protein